MAIQSFKFDIDFLNNLEKPIIYVAKQNKEFLGSVAIYDDLSLTFNLNAYQTATFKIYRDINGNRQENFEYFTENRLIMIQGISWYKIHVETNIENTGISKTISATSLECILGYKRLIDFQVNSDDLESDDDADDKYAGTIFYDPSNPNRSLLNRALNVAPSWSVGHVDSSLANKQRTFDEDDTDVYSFLTGDVSEAFNCLFIFDTFNQTVNAYDLDNYGDDTSIYVSMDNLAQSMTETVDENSIITCYWITRNDDVDVSEVNPNGTRKIYNFEYFLPQMSESLQAKVKAYNEKFQSSKANYEAIVAEMQTYLEKYQELLTRNPESATSEDWTLYGLYMLEDRQKSYKNIDEVYCAQGMNVSSSIQYQSYLDNKKKLDAVTAELAARQSEIDVVLADYNAVYDKLKAVQSELDMDKWFTKDEWIELDSYVIEETYSNDNFSISDNTDDSELFSVEKELYDAAWKDLSKKCRPQYQYTSTLSNVLTIPQFKDFLQYFQLGNFIRMATDYDTIIKLRLISFTVDYSDTSKIDVTFSDAIRVHDIYDDASSIQAQANSAAMSFQFNKDQYDKSSKQSNWVAEIRKYGLDVATVQIHNAKNQSQTWDDSGMTFRMWNEERNAFDPEQIKIINNLMAFTDGDGQVRMAIGKIPIDKNGNTAFGFNAEVLFGKAIFGENLTIQNNSGKFLFDNNGFSATSGNNSIKINPDKSGELFSIYKGTSKQFYVDADGNVHFTGDLSGATGTFSGLVSGGSINIGNNTFTVDENGNMTANSGTFGGTLNGADGTFSGNVTAYSGVIGGWNINNSSLSSKDGSVQLSSDGTISGATITGANGSFTEGFSVELPERDYNALVAQFILKTTSDGIFIGLKPNSGGTYGFRMRDGKVYINGVSTSMNEPDPDHLVYVNGKKAATLSDVPTSTSNLPPVYATSNSKLIKFKEASADYCGATPAWVKSYVSGQIPSNIITGFSGDSISGVYNSIRTSGKTIVGSKISYTDLKSKVSDIRLKKDVAKLSDITDFYMNLKPTIHRYKNGSGIGEDNRLQFGLIAQWTENDMKKNKLNPSLYSLVRKTKPFADTEQSKYTNGDNVYKIDYDQFHAMHIYMIQKQQKEIEELKNEIRELKGN